MNVTLTEVSGVFVARSAGYLASAPVGAAIVSNSNRGFVLLTHTLLMVTTLAVMPAAAALPYSMPILYSAAGVNGMASGGLEAIVNVWLLDVWKKSKHCPSLVQTLHFCFALGCASAPITAAPFLTGTQDLVYAFMIAAGISGVAVLLQLPLLIRRRSAKRQSLPMETAPLNESPDHETADPDETSSITRQVLMLSSIFLVVYSGTSIMYNQFLPTLLQTSYGMSPETSSYIHSSLNYLSSAARAASIFVAIRFAPQTLLFLNLSMFGGGSLFLLLFSHISTECIWIGNIMIGLGMGGCSGPLYAFLNQHMDVSNMTGSVFVFCSGLTSTFAPLLLAAFMAHYPSFLLAFNTASISLSLIIVTMIYVLCSRRRGGPQSVTARGS